MTKEGLRQLEEAEIDTIVAEIEAEKAAAEAAKKGPVQEWCTKVVFLDLVRPFQHMYVLWSLLTCHWYGSCKEFY